MEVTDILLNGRKIIQDSECFMYGIDAVLLSYFVRENSSLKGRLIDLGTGNGIIPLLLENAASAKEIVGLEIQDRLAAMAERSLALNELQDKIKIVKGDIRKVNSLFEKHSFDLVLSNPPYMTIEQGKTNPSDEKALARHELLCSLPELIAAADYLLHTHGRFFMIHRAERLAEIFALLIQHKLEPKKMRLVQPFEKTDPNLVLVEARKNAGPGLKIQPPLIVRNKPSEKGMQGEYTEELLSIYKSFNQTEDRQD